MREFVYDLTRPEQLNLAEIAVNSALKKVLNLELNSLKKELVNLAVDEQLSINYKSLQDRIVYLEDFVLMINNLFTEFYQQPNEKAET